MQARQIRALRKSLKMSQERFAQKIGVSALTIVRWENQKNKISRLGEMAIKNFMKERGKSMPKVMWRDWFRERKKYSKKETQGKKS